MNTLYAVSEELADDVVAAVDAYSITRPYTESNASEDVFAAHVSSDAGAIMSMSFDAPLGLIKFEPFILGSWAPDDEFIVDVHAIYEMWSYG